MALKQNFASRRFVINAIILIIALIFIIRLFYIQIIDETFKSSADNNVLRYITEYPARGLIYDINGKPLIYNEATYDLMVIPRQMGADFDSAGLCRLIGMDMQTFRKKNEGGSKILRLSTYHF